RRGAVAHRSALGLSLPPALSARDGAVLAGGPRDQGRRAGASGGLAPVLSRRRGPFPLAEIPAGLPPRAVGETEAMLRDLRDRLDGLRRRVGDGQPPEV